MVGKVVFFPNIMCTYNLGPQQQPPRDTAYWTFSNFQKKERHKKYRMKIEKGML